MCGVLLGGVAGVDRKRCMDLVSLETEAEWEKVRDKMEEFRAPFIWTSGHICDREVGTR